MSATARKAIPMTVVAGFLGAGKTTLLNRLLRDAGDRRLAVMVNDFGAINIDAELVASRDADSIDLTNGCICCSLGAEFLFALAGLRDRADPPDHVIIEASGIGDPATIAQYGDIPGYRRDLCIVLADAETVREQAAHPRIGAQVMGQLKGAHLVVLNKADLVSGEELAATRAWLREALPFATVVDASFGEVPLEFLLGEREGEGEGDADRRPAALPSVPATGAAPHDHAHAHAHPDYASWSWTGAAPIDGTALSEFLPTLPDGVVRAKGLLHLREDPAHRYVLQLAGRRWHIKRDRAWEQEPPRSQLVVIGLPEAVDPAALEQTLAALSSTT